MESFALTVRITTQGAIGQLFQVVLVANSSQQAPSRKTPPDLATLAMPSIFPFGSDAPAVGRKMRFGGGIKLHISAPKGASTSHGLVIGNTAPSRSLLAAFRIRIEYTEMK